MNNSSDEKGRVVDSTKVPLSKTDQEAADKEWRQTDPLDYLLSNPDLLVPEGDTFFDDKESSAGKKNKSGLIKK